MAEKETNKQTLTKEIITPKDLESVKPLEEVKFTYYYNILPLDKKLPCTEEGIFGGSFEVNNEKYFVISNMKQSATSLGQYFLSSSLYKIQGKAIIDMIHFINEYCDKENKSGLEATIKRHVAVFNTSKLNDLNNKQ